MKSMTGYACRERQAGEIFATVEIKSVNSRFFDLSVNLPHWLSMSEKSIRDFFSGKVIRGKVEVTVRVREGGSHLAVCVDPAAAKAYAAAFAEIAAALGRECEIPLSLIVSQEGVLRAERAQGGNLYAEIIAPLMEEAFAEFDSSRAEEGAALKADILSMAAKIESSLSVIEKRLPLMEETFRGNIRARFEEMLGALTDDDKRRIMQEIAALLVKYTINEEIVRLHSHLAVLCRELDENPAPGKKIDFICQEINREANTIGSKNQDFEVAQAVISIKDSLENIREQARNIE